MAGTWIEEAKKVMKETDKPLHYKKELMPKVTGLGAVLEYGVWFEDINEGRISENLKERLNRSIKEEDEEYEYIDVPLISKDAILKKDKIDSHECNCWRIIDKEEYRLYIPKNKDEVRLENLDKARFVHNSIKPEKDIKKDMPDKAKEIEPGTFKIEKKSNMN